MHCISLQYLYINTCTYVCIYIYIYRERERYIHFLPIAPGEQAMGCGSSATPKGSRADTLKARPSAADKHIYHYYQYNCHLCYIYIYIYMCYVLINYIYMSM